MLRLRWCARRVSPEDPAVVVLGVQMDRIGERIRCPRIRRINGTALPVRKSWLDRRDRPEQDGLDFPAGYYRGGRIRRTAGLATALIRIEIDRDPQFISFSEDLQSHGALHFHA